MSSPRLTLYAVPSPAVQCVPIALEELNLSYEVKAPSLQDKEQKSEWYLKLNPNGRLPTLVDHSKEDFAVWESSAILLYAAQHFDSEHRISYDPVKEPNLYSEQLQWIFFADGGIAPIQGQATHFMRLAPEEIPYAIKRYMDEWIRLVTVIEERLKGRDWLVGPHYSVADIKIFPWLRGAKLLGYDISNYPNVQKWLERILARPKTKKGLSVPADIDFFVEMPLEASRAFGAAIFGFKKVE